MSPLALTRTASADDLAALHALADRASAEAQSPALNEQSLLALKDEIPAGWTVLLAESDDHGAPELVGALVVSESDDVVGAELVLPAGPHRDDAGLELAAALEAIAQAQAGRIPTRLWAHGRLSPVAQLAQQRGYAKQRLLARLVRPGDLPAPEAAAPDGIRIAPFRPGVDDAAWLAVNAAAFADHAEQGQWTEADLRDRMESGWFDPAGFFLAWLDESALALPQAGITTGPQGLAGFHWTKTEPDPRHLGTECGEVYVIGVWPGAAGLHLGSSLLSAGLAHLQAKGVARVYLYVDGDNDRARSLYEHVGFTEDDVDICFGIA